MAKRRKKRNGPVASGLLKFTGFAALAGAAYYGFTHWRELKAPEGALVVEKGVYTLPGPDGVLEVSGGGDDIEIPFLVWVLKSGGMYGYSWQTPIAKSRVGRAFDIPEKSSSLESGGYLTQDDAKRALFELLKETYNTQEALSS